MKFIFNEKLSCWMAKGSSKDLKLRTDKMGFIILSSITDDVFTISIRHPDTYGNARVSIFVRAEVKKCLYQKKVPKELVGKVIEREIRAHLHK